MWNPNSKRETRNSKLPSAYRVENVDLFCLYRGRQSVETPHVIASKKDIHVLPDLALLVKYAIAKSWMLIPKRVENLANGIEIRVERDLGLTTGEVFKMTG